MSRGLIMVCLLAALVLPACRKPQPVAEQATEATVPANAEPANDADKP